MSKLRRTTHLALALALLMTSAFADTVTLKSGERIEGKIIGETDKELTLSVKISAAVTDDRVVAKADIAKVEKTSPETEAYKAISVIQPGANSLTPAQYEQVLRTLESYVGRFPNSVHAIDVQTTLNEFQAEKKRVEAGEVKVHQRWYSKAEAEKEKAQIGGLLTFEYMKAQSAAGDVIGALNTFVTLEKNYPGAAVLPDGIELAKQLVASLKPAVDRAIPNQKILKADREKGFAAAGPADRADLMAAYKREQTQAEDAVAAATAVGKWPPLIPGSEKSLTALQTLIAKEIPRLALLPVEKMKDSVELSNSAKQKMDAKDLDGAADGFKDATALWPANELAIRMTKEITKLKTEVKKAPVVAAATPTPTPASASPFDPLPNGDSPAPPKPDHKISAASTGDTASAPAVAAKKPEEAKPFYMTLGGAIGIVVAIAVALIGLNIFRKMRADADSEPE
jgi:hypothetical protein